MNDSPKVRFATYLENRPVLLNYAFRILGSREAAEDVVQEAYIRFSAQDRATEASHPKAYLFRIVRNLALNSSKRRRYESDQLRHETPDWGLPAAPLTPEEVLLFGKRCAVPCKSSKTCLGNSVRRWSCTAIQGTP